MKNLETKYWLEKYSGWMLILISCMIPVLLWGSINEISNSFSTPYELFSSLGKVFGLVGFILYSANLLLAVRRSWLENFFQGLNRVYIAHHITGGLALVFISFHPLFLALRYIDLKLIDTFGDAAVFLWPRSIDTTLKFVELQEAVAINAGMVAFWGMVVLLVLTFFVVLPYRFWLFTHRFLGVAFLFALLHIILITSDTSRSLALKWYLILWGIVGVGAFLYRTVFGSIFVRKTRYKVIEATSLDSITRIELVPTGKPMQYKSGQFIFIRFLWCEQDGIINEAHPFSIASSPNEDKIRLYIKSLGDFTSSLQGLKQGAIAEIEGAFGRFVPVRYGNAPQVWIAGGIGITPFLSMAKSLKDTPQSINLIYSVGTRSELVEESELKDYLPMKYKNFNFIPYITDEQSGKYLDVDFIEKSVAGFEGKEIFLCGPPPMMRSLKRQLKNKGVKRRKIHSEEFAIT